MARLLEMVILRKEKLIELLIENHVYKTSDHQHLYDAPLKVLQNEYELIVEKEKKFK